MAAGFGVKRILATVAGGVRNTPTCYLRRHVLPSWPARHSSNVNYPIQLASVSENHADLYKESVEQPERFWGNFARNRLRWVKNFYQVLDCDMTGDKINWFSGGKINVSGECLNLKYYSDSV